MVDKLLRSYFHNLKIMPFFGPGLLCIGFLEPNQVSITHLHAHTVHPHSCKMAAVTEMIQTTGKYHQFDLSRADGIFDGSQVSNI